MVLLLGTESGTFDVPDGMKVSLCMTMMLYRQPSRARFARSRVAVAEVHTGTADSDPQMLPSRGVPGENYTSQNAAGRGPSALPRFCWEFSLTSSPANSISAAFPGPRPFSGRLSSRSPAS